MCWGKRESKERAQDGLQVSTRAIRKTTCNRKCFRRNDQEVRMKVPNLPSNPWASLHIAFVLSGHQFLYWWCKRIRFYFSSPFQVWYAMNPRLWIQALHKKLIEISLLRKMRVWRSIQGSSLAFSESTKLRWSKTCWYLSCTFSASPSSLATPKALMWWEVLIKTPQ